MANSFTRKTNWLWQNAEKDPDYSVFGDFYLEYSQGLFDALFLLKRDI